MKYFTILSSLSLSYLASLDETNQDLVASGAAILNMKTHQQPCIITSKRQDNIFSLAQLLIDTGAISESFFGTITSDSVVSAKEMVGVAYSLLFVFCFHRQETKE